MFRDERCYKCHGGEERKGGFSMVRRESFLPGGEFGPAVALGKSEESLLIELVTSTDKDERMPSKGDRLSLNQIPILRAWIHDGFPWDALQRTPGHPFYEKLNAMLDKRGLEAFVEQKFAAYYANRMRHPSMPPLEHFTIEMAFICASEDKVGKEQKRSHSGLRRVFVTQAADAATSRWATDQS